MIIIVGLLILIFFAILFPGFFRVMMLLLALMVLVGIGNMPKHEDTKSYATEPYRAPTNQLVPLAPYSRKVY